MNRTIIYPNVLDILTNIIPDSIMSIRGDTMNSFDNITPFLRIEIKYIRFISHESKWVETKIAPEHRIWNITNGNLYITQNNRTFTLGKGDIILFSPGTHYTASTDKNGCEFLYTHFTVKIGNNIDILGNTHFAGIIQNKFIGKAALKYAEESAKNYMMQTCTSFNSYVLFINFFKKIIDTIQYGSFIPFVNSSTETPKAKLWKVISYIGAYFNRPLKVADLAEMAELSEKYFSHQFKDYLGISPKQYIMQCRMVFASDRLINSTDSVESIAIDTGYANIYSFSKAFKKYYGESPAEYRNKSMRK